MDVRKPSHHPLAIRRRALYTLSLSLPTGPKVLLEAITETVLAGGRFQPSQQRVGELAGRRRETVNRWVRVLRERGLVRVVRRGKRMTNFYLLARALWCRLTGRVRPKLPAPVQESLFRLGLRMGVNPDTMLGAGVRGGP
jgi:hypothetical protein